MDKEFVKARRGIRFSIIFIGILWSVKAFELALSREFTFLGVYPRTFEGSIGIITGPLVHADIFHLLSNSIPILILVVGLFYFYQKISVAVFFLIYFMTGFWVWVAARDAFHLGASGLVYGLISFLLFSGFIRRDLKSLSVSFAIMILYGGNMIYGIIPGNEGVSWESHLLGLLSGLFLAVYFRKAELNRRVKQESVIERNITFVNRNFFSQDKSMKVDYRPNDKKETKTFTYTIGGKDKDK